jgi:hypothetical protein
MLFCPAAAAQKAVVAQAPAGDKQAALAVGFDAHGSLRAAVCARGPCDVATGTDLALPEEARALASKARLSVMRVAPARRVITVDVDDPAHARTWFAVVAAPIDGSATVKILFSGWTGLVEGEWGLRHGPMVQRGGPNADGTWSLVIGEQREDLSLCGRPAILAPKMVAPDLTLKPAKVQRLLSGERENAREVSARALPPEAPVQGYKLLRATGASSAIGSPGALTDGDPSTTWAENRGGEGRGEFVLMDAPSQLPITGFELVIRPPGAEPKHGVAPADFWLATRKELIHVTLPKDAWKTPGARFEIPLETPLRDDCLALVTEGAQGGDAQARVTFAELSARTEFDASTMDGLVGALAGGSERSEAAAEALRALGLPAVEAIARAFSTLDEGGRRVALSVLDQAPCAASVPTYVRALTGPFAAHRLHARDRLHRCGSESAEALSDALAKAQPRLRPLLAAELSSVAPDRAVREVVPLLAQADPGARRLFRKALAHATRAPAARSAIRAHLADDTLPEVAAVDLLRALGDRVAAHRPEAVRALVRLAHPGASFRTRYLLAAPAAELADDDPEARAVWARLVLKDPSKHVRAEAARRIRHPERHRAELEAALDDPEVRVREAALAALDVPTGAFAMRKVSAMLSKDRWPLVRSAAASALAKYGADAEADQALASGLGDSAPSVRARVVSALGERRASAHARQIRERLGDGEEAIDVRVNAAVALGLLCDRASTDMLSEYAAKLVDPAASPAERALGPVALGALGRIHPPDLQKRIGRLLDPKTPTLVRGAARAALAEPQRCK